jgi:hypothetical protein
MRNVDEMTGQDIQKMKMQNAVKVAAQTIRALTLRRNASHKVAAYANFGDLWHVSRAAAKTPTSSRYNLLLLIVLIPHIHRKRRRHVAGDTWGCAARDSSSHMQHNNINNAIRPLATAAAAAAAATHTLCEHHPVQACHRCPRDPT